jgi:hypothetical protein
VQTRPELIGRSARPAERRLVQILIEAAEFRERLARDISESLLHRGLETERIFNALLPVCLQGQRPDTSALGATLEEADRRLFFEIVFESASEAGWDEAESCLLVLQQRQAEQELLAVQKEIEVRSSRPEAAAELNELLKRKQKLRQRLAAR